MRRTRSPTCTWLLWAGAFFGVPAHPSGAGGRVALRSGCAYRFICGLSTEAPITSSIKYLDPSIHSVNTVANLACLPNVARQARGKCQGTRLKRDTAQTQHTQGTQQQHSITSPRWIHLQRVKHLKLDVHVSQRAGAATDSAEHAPSWTNASNQPKTSVEAPPGGATTRVAVRATA